MNLIPKIKNSIKWFLPYGIIYHRNQSVQRIFNEQNFQREQKEREIKDYFLSLNSNVIEDSEILEIIDYFKNYNRCTYWYPYSFTRKYFAVDIDVFYDKSSKLKYVLHNNKRLYFPESWDSEYIRICYNNLRIEQDIDSPHRYGTDVFTVQEGDVIADIGAAEGIWALSYVEKASTVYLFEHENYWMEALQKTFEPWKEKVVVVNKYVSDSTGDEKITLDDFFHDKTINFIKADIEGAEVEMVKGGKSILERAGDISLVLCAYHKQDDAQVLKEMLENIGFRTEYSNRYMLCTMDGVKPPYIRRGIIRAGKTARLSANE